MFTSITNSFTDSGNGACDAYTFFISPIVNNVATGVADTEFTYDSSTDTFTYDASNESSSGTARSVMICVRIGINNEDN